MCSHTTDLPDELIRGISSADAIDEKGYAKSNLFTFYDCPGNPHFLEASINWYDSDEALTHIFQQRKASGVLQFEKGAAILSKNNIDIIKRRPASQEAFEYERKPIDGNTYHGNLLIKKTTSKNVQKMIAATLALFVDRIELPQFADSEEQVAE